MEGLDRPVPGDRMDLPDRQDSLVLLALMDKQGMRDLEGMLVLGDRLEQLVTQAALVQMASQDHEEMLDRLDLQGLKVALVQGVISALQDLQEPLVHKDRMEESGPVGRLDLRVSEETQVHKDPPDHQVKRVKLDPQVRKVSKARRDLQEQLEVTVPPVCVAMLGQREWLDKEVNLDRLERRGSLETMVNLAQPDPQVHLEFRVCRVHRLPVKLDRQGLQEAEEMLDHRVHQVLPVYLDHLVPEDPLVQMDKWDRQVRWVRKVHQAI